ncbi:hypothetical protein [Streptomyces sp. WM6372]|uniref:hypothetical protein n=1 Tax=Streptomyces sp. WM6372 TaxID=1415555 RepID=UPI00131D86A1|nr:hypothetical protein [Streptomyces sp. WM6372]
MNQYSAPQEPARLPPPAPACEPQPQPRARRAAARHRKSAPSRRLAAGLALASVVAATLITLTVDPAAPAPDAAPDATPHAQPAR